MSIYSIVQIEIDSFFYSLTSVDLAKDIMCIVYLLCTSNAGVYNLFDTAYDYFYEVGRHYGFFINYYGSVAK